MLALRPKITKSEQKDLVLVSFVLTSTHSSLTEEKAAEVNYVYIIEPVRSFATSIGETSRWILTTPLLSNISFFVVSKFVRTLFKFFVR